MPLKLNVGVSRKLGLPGFCSVGASCQIEVELDGGLSRRDPDGFDSQVREAFDAARRAVDDELARHRASSVPGSAGSRESRSLVDAPRNGHASSHGPERDQPGRSATASQVGAIVALARRGRVDLDRLLAAECGVDRPEDLSRSDASPLIDRLKTVGAR